MTRKFGEHPTDGKGLERVSAALKADSERSQAALASNPLRAEHYTTDREWAIALTAEIERLTRVHEQDSAEFRRLDERNDRLRAALLQIRDATVLPGGLTTLTRREMREIAETAVGNEPRARGGSSDETAGEPAAWMTDDGRVVNAESKRTCRNSSLNSYMIPLYRRTKETAAECSYEPQDGSTLTYETGCGNVFNLDPMLELYEFCPYCGRRAAVNGNG